MGSEICLVSSSHCDHLGYQWTQIWPGHFKPTSTVNSLVPSLCLLEYLMNLYNAVVARVLQKLKKTWNFKPSIDSPEVRHFKTRDTGSPGETFQMQHKDTRSLSEICVLSARSSPYGLRNRQLSRGRCQLCCSFITILEAPLHQLPGCMNLGLTYLQSSPSKQSRD